MEKRTQNLTMETEESNSKKNKGRGFYIGGVIFAGCMFLGMGIGHYLGAKQTGMYIGMGAGFLLMGVTWALIERGKNG